MSRFAPHGRTSFQTRRPPRSPQQLRADWVAAIMMAGSLAETVRRAVGLPGDCDPAFGQTLTRLSLTLRDLEPGNFPVQAESSRAMASAFLGLARAFCHPACAPQMRTACAGFLRAGAACLDDLMDALRSAEAEAGRRVLGERDG